jgi:hypothetical protein
MLRGHKYHPQCRDAVLRYAVTLQVCTHLKTMPCVQGLHSTTCYGCDLVGHTLILAHTQERNVLMHVPCIFILLLLLLTNAQMYITRQTSTLATATRDYIYNHRYALLTQDIVMSHRLYCITQRRPNNILVYFNPIILWNCNFNSVNFKNVT